MFVLHQGNGLELMHIETSAQSEINFVSRTAQNNGVVAQVERINNIEPFPTGCITVALGGSVLSSFVQLKPFYTAFHIMVLEPKKEMSLQEKFYWCMCIKANAYRYSYGRQANKTLKYIELPDVVPEWVCSTFVEPIKTTIKQKKLPPLNISSWKEFSIGELFSSNKGKTLSIKNKDIYVGDIPCVNGSVSNNGVFAYLNNDVEKIGFKLQKAPCITICRVGNSGFSNVQNSDFYIADNAYALRLKNEKFANIFVYLFLSTILNMETYKYSYGRIINSNYFDTRIKLPVTEQGSPDWGYMERYIKSLPYADRI